MDFGAEISRSDRYPWEMVRRYVKASADKLKFFQAQFDSACTMRDRYKSELERSQAELKTNLSKVGDESESIARVSRRTTLLLLAAFQKSNSLDLAVHSAAHLAVLWLVEIPVDRPSLVLHFKSPSVQVALSETDRPFLRPGARAGAGAARGEGRSNDVI